MNSFRVGVDAILVMRTRRKSLYTDGMASKPTPKSLGFKRTYITFLLAHSFQSSMMKLSTTYTLFTLAFASLSSGLKISSLDHLNLHVHFAPELDLSTTYSQYMVPEPQNNSTSIYANIWDSAHLSHVVHRSSVTTRLTKRNTSKVTSPHFDSSRNESQSSTAPVARRNSSKISHENHEKLNDLIVKIQGYAAVVLFGVWLLIWLGGHMSTLYSQSQDSCCSSKRATPHVIMTIL